MRAPTGSVEWGTDAWYARITMPDGKRPRIRLDGVPRADRARAVEIARAMAAQVRTGGGYVPESRLETVTEYSERWVAYRKAQKRAAAPDDLSRLRNHILPVLGTLPIRSVSREVVEDFVTALDRRVQAGALSWKMAGHIWGTLRSMLDDATRAKDRAVRAGLETSPIADVRGPERGAKIMRTVLRVDEFVSLVSCPEVPLARAQAYAVATYLCLRAGELAALDWQAVHLDGSKPYVEVHRSIDRKRRPKSEGATKGKRGRLVPVPPALVPLLEALRGEKARGPVMTRLARPGAAAELLRLDLRCAGVLRSTLHVESGARKPITFHDLRATGVTWLVARGDAALAVKESAGHGDYATTAGYVRMAEVLGDEAPFPALPERLNQSSGNRPIVYGKQVFSVKNSRRDRGRNWDGDAKNQGDSKEVSENGRTIEPKATEGLGGRQLDPEAMAWARGFTQGMTAWDALEEYAHRLEREGEP